MKVGDLIQFRREPVVEGLPIGLVIETAGNSGDHIWCKILWDDGTQGGAWDSELVEVA